MNEIETHLCSTGFVDNSQEMSKTSLTEVHIATDEATHHAIAFLRSRGYDITELPVMVEAPPDSLWVSEPGEESYAQKAYDWMSPRDLMELAEALEFSRVCAFCGLPAESKCPDCGTWTCYEDRRDFSPNFDDHLCGPCVGKRNLAMVEQWREMAARGETLNEQQQYWVDK